MKGQGHSLGFQLGLGGRGERSHVCPEITVVIYSECFPNAYQGGAGLATSLGPLQVGICPVFYVLSKVTKQKHHLEKSPWLQRQLWPVCLNWA